MNAPAAARPIRVLAVDDHALLRGGIASVLEGQSDIDLIAEASNGLEAVEKCLKLRPDVTLMDIQMPMMDGIEATREICAIWPEARIVILTTYKGDVKARRAIQAGASGFMLKSMLRHDLMETIREVHAGKDCIPADIAREIAVNITERELSFREIPVLRLAALGYANRRIGAALSVTEDTIKMHMKSVLQKLGANDRTHAVTLAIKRGVIDIAS